jgi:hypothetical protein
MRVRTSVLLLALAGGCGRADQSPKPGAGPGVTAPGDGRTAGVDMLPGALDDGAKVTVERAASAEAYQDPAGRLVGPVWAFRVEGHAGKAFKYPIPMHLPYDPEAVPQGDTVQVSRWEEGRWDPLPDSEADPLAGVVRTLARHQPPRRAVRERRRTAAVGPDRVDADAYAHVGAARGSARHAELAPRRR